MEVLLLKFYLPLHSSYKMTLRRYSRYIKLVFLAWDIILLNTAYVLSFYIRFGSIDKLFTKDNSSVILISNLLWILLSVSMNTYKFIRTEGIEKVFSRFSKQLFYHLLLIFTSIFILKYTEISRSRLLYFYGLFGAEIFVFRIFFLSILKSLRRKGYNYRNVIIAGVGKEGKAIYNFLSRDLVYGYRLLGFFDDIPKTPTAFEFLGKVDDITNYIENNNVHELYWTIENYDAEKMSSLINFCENHLVRIKFVPNFTKFLSKRNIHIEFYDFIPVISVRKEPLQRTVNRIAKRIFDLFFSSLIILFVFPWLFPILILLVKTSSRGPIFFKQQRSGEDNKTFFCWKFRTMKMNTKSDIQQATKGDPRITKIGTFLRKSNLDEFPQFINVLLGEMSIVGPRPHMLKHTEEYSAQIKNYLARHFVRPGITGWAQVNGFRGETKELEQMEKRVEYDIWYIENWSFFLDLKIIVKTGMNMFKGEENAG
jgi:putative colanic acid biosysnthesis UDP-glucose lipid carrier transferase